MNSIFAVDYRHLILWPQCFPAQHILLWGFPLSFTMLHWKWRGFGFLLLLFLLFCLVWFVFGFWLDFLFVCLLVFFFWLKIFLLPFNSRCHLPQSGEKNCASVKLGWMWGMRPLNTGTGKVISTQFGLKEKAVCAKCEWLAIRTDEPQVLPASKSFRCKYLFHLTKNNWLDSRKFVF